MDCEARGRRGALAKILSGSSSLAASIGSGRGPVGLRLTGTSLSVETCPAAGAPPGERATPGGRLRIGPSAVVCEASDSAPSGEEARFFLSVLPLVAELGSARDFPCDLASCRFEGPFGEAAAGSSDSRRPLFVPRGPRSGCDESGVPRTSKWKFPLAVDAMEPREPCQASARL